MGFSITACVLAGIMFIFYCFAVAKFGEILRCKYDKYPNYPDYYPTYNEYCYSTSKRNLAAVGAGLGACLLILSLVEFFVSLASSIYCCTGLCCNTLSGAVGTVSSHSFFFLLETVI